MKQMRLELLVKRNRERKSPLPTMLEIVVDCAIRRPRPLGFGVPLQERPSGLASSMPSSASCSKCLASIHECSGDSEGWVDSSADDPTMGAAAAGPPLAQPCTSAAASPAAQSVSRLPIPTRCSSPADVGRLATACLALPQGGPSAPRKSRGPGDGLRGKQSNEAAEGDRRSFKVTCSELPSSTRAIAGRRAAGEAVGQGSAVGTSERPRRVEITSRSGERIVIHEEELCGRQVELSGLRGCTIYLFGWSSQLTLDGCTDCSLISGPTDGAVFARGCARVRLYVACRQFRARDCNSCEAFLFTFGPVIEKCTRMIFGEYHVAYPHLARHFEEAQISPTDANRWYSVFDYSVADPPNFSLLNSSPRVQVDESISGSSEPCECPVAPPPTSTDSASKASVSIGENGARAALEAKDFARTEASIVKPGAWGEVAGGQESDAVIEGDLVEEEIGAFTTDGSSEEDTPASTVPSMSQSSATLLALSSKSAASRSGVTQHGRPPRPASAKGKTISDKILRELASAEMVCDGTLTLDRPIRGHSADSYRSSSAASIPSPSASPSTATGEPLTPSALGELHALLMGTSTSEWSPAWRYQALEFTQERSTPYGLIQHHGGSCGVMAAVQALLVRRMLYPLDGRAAVPIGQLRAGPARSEDNETAAEAAALAAVIEARNTSLIDALCDLLMPTQIGIGDGRSGNTIGSSIKIVLCTKDSLPTLRGLPAALVCHTLPAARPALKAFLSSRLAAFTRPGGSGVALFVYSLLLTRGLDAIRSEMDCSSSPLIDRRGYCSQELVNSLCIGRAVSNVFDGERSLRGDGDTTDALTLRGLNGRAPVGLLCLAESIGHYEVGDYYKHPWSPIWLCYMESHYTVVFSPTPVASGDELVPTGSAAPALQLVYYDQLGHQDEHIVLKLHFNDHVAVDDNDLVPPLVATLRTRWPTARVHWGNTDPLL